MQSIMTRPAQESWLELLGPERECLGCRESEVRCMISEMQQQVPIRLRSGQAFDSAEVRFAQDDSASCDMDFGDRTLAW
jgi:hypothetical protein